MAEKIKINRCTNANIYLDGGSFLGRAEEISLPDIKFKNAEHKAIGMVGSMEFFSGIEKMEGKIKWNSFYAEVLKKVADPTKQISLQVRASVETYGSGGRLEQKPLVVFLSIQAKNFPAGNFKQHDNVELETSFNCYYMKQEFNGEEIVEIDVLSNTYKVNGVDLLATYKNNLGI
jgi:P2 family phage contractile tail tube protein